MTAKLTPEQRDAIKQAWAGIEVGPGMMDRTFDRADEILSEPEGVWVEPGDGVRFQKNDDDVYGNRGCIAKQLGAAIEHNWLPVFHSGLFHYYGNGAHHGPIPSTLRTLDGKRVLGVRQPSWTDDDMRECVRRFVATGDPDRPIPPLVLVRRGESLLTNIIALMRDQRKGG